MKKIPIIVLLIILIVSCEKTNYLYNENRPQFIQVPEATNITNHSATIGFEVSGACNGKLFYTVGHFRNSVIIENYKQSHQVLLDNLYPGQNYKIWLNLNEYYDHYSLQSDTITIEIKDNLFSLGWQQYNVGNYTGALEKFQENQDTTRFRNWNLSSMGWCCLKLGKLSEAKAYFAEAETINQQDKLTLLGLMVLAQSEGAYEQVATLGEEAMDSNWSFLYHDQYNIDLVNLLSAEAYFFSDRFDDAVTCLNKLIAPPIDMNNPETWVFKSNNYNSIEELIIDVINYLKTEY